MRRAGAADADGVHTVTYRVRVENTGVLPAAYGPLLDTPAFAEGLRVLDATWTATGPQAPAGPAAPATGPGPFTLAPAGTTLPRGATHTYDVAVRFHHRPGHSGASACEAGAAGAGLGQPGQPAGRPGTAGTDDNTACLDAPAAPSASLVLDKQSDPVTDLDGNGVDAGDTIDYRFVVTQHR